MKKVLSFSLLLSFERTARKFILSNPRSIIRTMGGVICKNADPAKNTSMAKPEDTEYVEDIVCQTKDIKENEIKSFDLKDAGKILLIKQNGVLSALGNKCTHYGAPLDKGALGKGVLRCQWHGACFNILTGDIEDFPGLDSLPCYQVKTDGDNIVVRAKKSELGAKRVKLMAKLDPRESTHMVVIGGGPSGAVCVETLRQEGFTGKITLINKENCLPYDRVKLSKALDVELNKIELRTASFYHDNNINVLQNVEATNVDTANKTIQLNNGTSINYDCLYIATGSKPRELQVPGSKLSQVCTLRGFEDSQKIHQMITENSNVVCLGSSFISMEAAAYCASKAKSVTVIGRGNAPFKPVFGEAIGLRIVELFKEKGVNFYFNTSVKKCHSENNKLQQVELEDGSILPCDILITGLGSTLYTSFLQDSGISLNTDGSISVNEYLETNIKNVFAGGDIAKAPVFCNNNRPSSIGHYPLAHYHGRIAGLNMLGRQKPLKTVPYFWTMLFGKSLRYSGHGQHDDVKIIGDLQELKFYAFHFEKDRVIAMSSCQMDPIVSQFANYLAEGKQLYRKDIETNPLGWQM